MSITLTEKATSEVKRVLEAQDDAEVNILRIGVTGGGCSGFTYSLSLDKQYDPKVDSKYDFDGVSVVVDKKSSLFLEGLEVDYHEGIDKRGFVFKNPTATKTCGCGHSFQA